MSALIPTVLATGVDVGGSLKDSPAARPGAAGINHRLRGMAGTIPSADWR